MTKHITSIFLIGFLSINYLGLAQENAEELAKKLANPVASLISVPFQNNTDYGIGNFDGSRNTLNIQPVIPISIGENTNLITRAIVPIISQHNITGLNEKQSGMSDIVLSGFFSPKNAKNGITWGAGPVILLPTGTNDYLTTKNWGAGPTAVILKQSNGWTFGALANQIWSLSGDKNRPDVNQMFLQPFLVYNWKTGAGVGANAEYTQNWQANTSTIYLNPTISGVTSFGKQKVQLAVGPRISVAAPNNSGSSWGWRAVVVFLFPT
jgi:hypothetical protein